MDNNVELKPNHLLGVIHRMSAQLAAHAAGEIMRTEPAAMLDHVEELRRFVVAFCQTMTVADKDKANAA